MNKREMDSYSKTENILKNYNKIKKSRELLMEELKSLEEEKQKISKLIMKTNKVVLKEEDQNYYYTDETLENRINELKQFVIKLDAEIEFINKSLREIEKDNYYQIITKFYFEKNTVEKIAEEFDTSTQTIYYHKGRLIHELSYLLSPLDKIDEIRKMA